MLSLSFTSDNFRILYGILTIFAFAMSTLFAPAYLGKHVKRFRFYGFTAIVLIGTLGVFFAADFVTLLVFFELMSLASYVWVAYEEDPGALRAGDTYMAVAIMGGLSLLMGILLYEHNISIAWIFLFFGFGAKAGAYPVHVWLPKAHPVAPAPLSALLSGVLTKTGVFGIMLVSIKIMEGDRAFGLFVLIIGLLTMVTGALTAVFSVNLKKILACSSVSQIGFMLTGIAVANLLSDEELYVGTVVHMANHTLVKLVVFLTAGVVYENLHALNLNDIKGFGRKKPALMVPYAIAALSLAGIPGFMGYYSKSIIHEGLVECAHVLNPAAVSFMEWVFLISGGATLCYMAKIFKVLFIDKPAREMPTKSYLNIAQAIAVIVPSIVIAGASVYLGATRFTHLFEFEVLSGGLISVTIGIVLLALITLTIGKGADYRDVWPKWLNLEERVYRPLLLSVLPLTIGFVARLMDKVGDTLVYAVRKTILRDSPLPAERVEGTIFTHIFGRTIDVFRAFFKGEHVVRNTTERHMALRSMEVEETMKVFRRSLSYGLLLACVGIFIILGFILYLVFI